VHIHVHFSALDLCRPSACQKEPVLLCADADADSANAIAMEALLSLAFDNTSSKEIIKIRKGLRQIEGLLAQICIPPSCSQQKRRPSSTRLSGDTLLPPRQLSSLCQDPAYREFFRLQEGFEWNGTSPVSQHHLFILTAV
jgi:hypothetical protein